MTTIHSTLIHKPTTSHIGSYTAPNNAYIITVVLIGIIIIILMYFCISENSRNVMITLFYWFCALILKIIMLGPALLALLYCYTYKAFIFIRKKNKTNPRIDVVLQTIVVTNNTDVSTDISSDTTIDMITYTIGFIVKCYTCS